LKAHDEGDSVREAKDLFRFPGALLEWLAEASDSRVIPVGEGFIVTENQVNDWIKADPKNKDVLKLFSMGANLAKNPHGLPERWIIDFNDMPIEVDGEIGGSTGGGCHVWVRRGHGLLKP
jgi:hypothetical protein